VYSEKNSEYGTGKKTEYEVKLTSSGDPLLAVVTRVTNNTILIKETKSIKTADG